SAVLTAGSFFIVPRHVLGRGFTAPSDKLGLAAIGAGGKGKSDILNAWNKRTNEVVALCDVDTGQCKDSISKFRKASFYHDYRKMFDEMHNDIDAVTISTPDHTHAVIAMAAMSLGKHVYVQKPLTHDIHEARMLTETARERRVVSQMGNQGASNPAQKQMVEWFNSGIIGTVDTVHVWTNRPVWPQGIPAPSELPSLPDTMNKEHWDLFIGPAKMVDYHPLYHPFKWRGWWNFGTGALGDMGCHLIDTPFRVLQLGYPEEVQCSVGQVFTKDWVPEYIPEGCPPSSRVEIKFPRSSNNPAPVKLTWHDGGLRPFHPDLIPAEDFIGEENSTNGVLMIGEKGIMTCGTYGRNPKIYLKSGEQINMPETTDSELPEWGHQISWTEACKDGFDSPKHKSLTSSFDYAGPLTETVLMGNLAIRSYMLGEETKDRRGRLDFPGRKKLRWDGAKMKITNFDPANQFVQRDYREGWKLA
ncbi:MAG: Gfo/Idh/MocA family oxidoreductase, partial [Saprospiraceae bacterium]|nr:Gfo/Idh/MocA family oxidoreductase [Saprospiraceae bacterium]